MWHMDGEIVKKQGRAGLYISCNYSYIPYFIVKILFRKYCSGRMGSFLLPGGNDKNLGKVFLGDMSRNEQIQFFVSQMYLPVTP